MLKIENLHCHSFAPDLAKRAEVAIDCGANHGDFARWLSQNTLAKIYSFEPDPRLFCKLPVLERVEWIELAIDGEPGEFSLGLGEKHCSSAIYREDSNQKVIEVRKNTLDAFCEERQIRAIDFLKIDIEGAELSVLEKCSAALLQSTTQITVEFHDFLDPTCVPRIKAIFSRMRGLGFHCFCFSHHTWGDCFFLNAAKVKLSALDLAAIYATKYTSGFQRIFRRVFRLRSS